MPQSLTRRALDFPAFWFVLWLVTLLIGLGLALQSMGCAHPVGRALNSAPPRNGLSSASVVTLLRVRHADPCTTDPEVEPCRYADTYDMAVSALYNQSAPGELVTELTEGWYETTQTVVHGWSGSPELDAQGRVWGLVAKCPTTAAGKCVAGHTYAVGLGAL